MLGLLAAIVAAPLALEAILPDLPRDRVGVYERVILSEPGPAGDVYAGFIAPAGWIWVGSRESGFFTTDDGRDSIRVALRTDVADPDALLRDGVPLGAVALPTGGLLSHDGLSISALQYDLAAGDNPAISIIACTDTEPADCVTLLGTFSAGDEADRDRAQQALVRVLASVELDR